MESKNVFVCRCVCFMLLEYISNININIRNLIHNVLGKLWLQLFVSPALDLPFNTSRGSVVMIGMVLYTSTGAGSLRQFVNF